MGDLEHGDVVSFRVPDYYSKVHLKHLSKFKGSKSSHLASLCLKGINADIQNKLYLDLNSLSEDTREWLTNPKNLEVLVVALRKEMTISTSKKANQNVLVSIASKENKEKMDAKTSNISLDSFVMSTFK